jgi:hypothetical protein
MLKIFLVISALLFSFSAKANLDAKDFGYKSCNHHQFTFVLLNVYDVFLCLDDKQYLYPKKIFETDFSLIINYNMNFDKEELSKSSIEEINRYYELSQKTQNIYYEELISIFPNIQKGDIIEAKYNKKGTVSFYHNKSLTGKINDAKFAKIFLDIWLYENNKHKKMTKDLFSK